MGNRRAALRELDFERVEPGRIGLERFGQQAVALAQGGFIAGALPGMAGQAGEHQTVEKAAAAPALSAKIRSIAGVSQVSESHSASRVAALARR
jgi:hypothetical protein